MELSRRTHAITEARKGRALSHIIRPSPSTPGSAIIAELSLLAVSTSVVFGFSRLFAGWSFFAPLIAVTVFTHLMLALTRRLSLGVGLSAAVVAPGWALLTTWLWFPETTRWLIPGSTTVAAVQAAMAEMTNAFQELHAPVPALPGFLIAAAVALGIAVFLADWAAFRLQSPMESLVPAVTIFAFATVLTADQHRTSSAILFAATTVCFMLLQRTSTIDNPFPRVVRSSRPLSTTGRGSMLVVGGSICLTAVLIGSLAGPRLPGVGDTPIYDWRTTGAGEAPRVTVSPLVDIRSRLVDQSDREVFVVESAEKAYWRLTALDTFDGTIWRSGGRYSKASGALDSQDNDTGDSVRLHQEFTITGLDALWLPAAFRPVQIDSGKISVRHQEESATLIVDSDTADSNGLTYTVESVLPHVDPADLRAATDAAIPDDIAQRYAQTPDGLSDMALQVASDVTHGSPNNPYDQALALQDFFRTNFIYDLAAPPGHGDSAIDDFLVARRGYCEQFAGTFAALARSLGIPTRVAVGFTWGEQDPENPDRYIVRGRHAHAWPEVYFAGFGWVPFEPTPGRGMPGAQSWTGTEAAQETHSASPATTSTIDSAVVTVPGSDGESPTDTSAEHSQPAEAPSSDTETPPNPDHRPRGLWNTIWIWLALGLSLCVATLVVVIPTIHSRQRQRRRADAASDDAARIRLAWLETTESLATLGLVRLPDETHHEFAERVSVIIPEHAEAITRLAVDVDAAIFAVHVIGQAESGQAASDRSAVHRSEATASAIAEMVRNTAPQFSLIASRFRRPRH